MRCLSLRGYANGLDAATKPTRGDDAGQGRRILLVIVLLTYFKRRGWF
jgi:hypothetical protein